MCPAIQTCLVVNGRPSDLIGTTRRQGGSNPKDQSVFPRVYNTIKQFASFQCIGQIGNPCGSIIALAGMIMIGLLNASGNFIIQRNGTGITGVSRTDFMMVDINAQGTRG